MVLEPVDSIFLAGPGTGKTKTLTSKVVYLLKNGASPQNMVVMTFTSKAVKETKDRVTQITGDDSLVKKPKIGTIHNGENIPAIAQTINVSKRGFGKEFISKGLSS